MNEKERRKPIVWLILFIIFAIMGPISIFYDFPKQSSDKEEVKEVKEVEEKIEEKADFQEEYGDMPPILRRQMSAINVDPLKNCGRGCGSNIDRVKGFGITIPEWIKYVDSYTLCADGMGCKKYSETRKRFLDILQPIETTCTNLDPESCDKLRVKNVVLMLSVLAIAEGQILLYHHGGCLKGWDDVSEKANWGNVNWEQNLKVIHQWINSPDIADNYMLQVVLKFAKNEGPNTKNIGAAYFSGQDMRNWGKEGWDKIKSIGKEKKYKHPNDYGRDIAKCFKEKAGYLTFWNSLHKRGRDEKASPWNTTVYKDSDILALKACLFRQETGGSHATFEGRVDAEKQERDWLNRGIEIDLISPEEARQIFSNASESEPTIDSETKNTPSKPSSTATSKSHKPKQKVSSIQCWVIKKAIESLKKKNPNQIVCADKRGTGKKCMTARETIGWFKKGLRASGCK